MKNRINPDIDHSRSTIRIVNFSDAVFAVAITLLVVQIPIPVNAPDRELGDDLVANIPMFISYAISFGVIALLWLKHLHFNNHVKRYSVGLIWLNFFFLLVIAFLPFPTGVYGTHSGDEVAQVFYAAVISLAGFLAALMWLVVLRQPALLHDDIDEQEVRHSMWVSMIMPTCFAVSIVFSFFYPEIMPYMWMMFAVASPLIRKI